MSYPWALLFVVVTSAFFNVYSVNYAKCLHANSVNISFLLSTEQLMVFPFQLGVCISTCLINSLINCLKFGGRPLDVINFVCIFDSLWLPWVNN